METLTKLYEKSSTSNKVFLMKHLFNMKMIEGGSIMDHLNEFNTITSQSSSVGMNFDEEIKALDFVFFSWKLEWLGMTVSNSFLDPVP